MKTTRLLTTMVLGAIATVAVLCFLSQGAPTAHGQGPDGYDTYYVAPGGDCGGMTPCYASVQAAVDAADDPGDVIKVASGTYTSVQGRPSPSGYNGPAAITQAVYISQRVTVRGGYTTTDWNTSDPEANPTTLDAQKQGRVLLITGDISPTIEGLRITCGDPNRLGGWSTCCLDVGGGVYVVNATANIKDNYVFSNTADYGGGLYLWQNNTSLSGNTISSNTADYGGGLYLWESNALLSGNFIASNTSTGFEGGGLHLRKSSAILSGNIIISNTAMVGGGLYAEQSTVSLTSNTVISNLADYGGGGLYMIYDDSTLVNNLVTKNRAGDHGGGLLWGDISGTLERNTITFNSADNYGGGLLLINSDATLINNLATDNQVDGQGSGIMIWRSLARLLHNTIARNRGGDGSGVHITNGGSGECSAFFTNTILVSHTVGITVAQGNTATLQATLWGTGTWANDVDWGGAGSITTGTVNLWGDPAFTCTGDACVAPYHIGPCSAARDAGMDAGVTTDIDGDARPDGCFFDIGADEFISGVECKRLYLPLILRAYP